MRDQHKDRPKQWRALMAFLLASAISFAGSAAVGNAQRPGRSTSAGRTSRIHELVRVNQLKEVFQRDSGKVRLVALVSPT